MPPVDDIDFNDAASLAATQFFGLSRDGYLPDSPQFSAALPTAQDTYAEFRCSFNRKYLPASSCPSYLSFMYSGAQGIESPVADCLRQANNHCSAIGGIPRVIFQYQPFAADYLPHKDFQYINFQATHALAKQRQPAHGGPNGMTQIRGFIPIMQEITNRKTNICQAPRMTANAYPQRDVEAVAQGEWKILLYDDSVGQNPSATISTTRAKLPSIAIHCTTARNFGRATAAYFAAESASLAEQKKNREQMPVVVGDDRRFTESGRALRNLGADLGLSSQVYSDRVIGFTQESFPTLKHYVWQGPSYTWWYLEGKSAAFSSLSAPNSSFDETATADQGERRFGLLLASPNQYREPLYNNVHPYMSDFVLESTPMGAWFVWRRSSRRDSERWTKVVPRTTDLYQLPEGVIDDYDQTISMPNEIINAIQSRSSDLLPNLDVQSFWSDRQTRNVIEPIVHRMTGSGAQKCDKFWIGRRFFYVNSIPSTMGLGDAVQVSLLREQAVAAIRDLRSAEQAQYLRLIPFVGAGIALGNDIKAQYYFGGHGLDIAHQGVRLVLEATIVGGILARLGYVAQPVGLGAKALLFAQEGSLLADLGLTFYDVATEGLSVMSSVKLLLYGLMLRHLPKAILGLRARPAPLNVVPNNAIALANVENAASVAARYGEDIGPRTVLNAMLSRDAVKNAMDNKRLLVEMLGPNAELETVIELTTIARDLEAFDHYVSLALKYAQ